MEEEPGPSKKRFGNQNVSLKNKKGMNDLMHVSLKQIQMLTNFDKYYLLLLYDNYYYIYILKYIVKEINLFFQMCKDVSS
jgi:predicted metal-dependent phosphotriesterase family hydrolase